MTTPFKLYFMLADDGRRSRPRHGLGTAAHTNTDQRVHGAAGGCGTRGLSGALCRVSPAGHERSQRSGAARRGQFHERVARPQHA